MNSNIQSVISIMVIITIARVYGEFTIVDFARSGNLFICNSGALLTFSRVCDGRSDCYDGSDEVKELCYRTVCPANRFKCHYGACVEKTKKCNGIRDCADGSDEMQCGRKQNSCAYNEFRCLLGTCIPSHSICNRLNDCPDGFDESSFICDNQLCPLNTFRCKYGGCIALDGLCDGFLDCLDGSDESSAICLAKRCPQCSKDVKCPAIKSSRIDVSCELNNRPVSCAEPMAPMTRATYTCSEFHLPLTQSDENNDQSICQSDGTWSRKILQCTPDCGRLGTAAVPLVANGWSVSEPFPWHVSIFRHQNGNYRLWCGATLITEAVVVTAAHCVWSVNQSDLKLVFGTTESDFNQLDYYTDVFKVRQIVMHPLYMDKQGNYGSDIALLEIDGSVDISEQLLPICIDWQLHDFPEFGDRALGMVMGMGVTENDSYSGQLRTESVPVVSNERCLEHLKEDFRKFLSFTTFCGGWANGTAVCNGDSGGGLVFGDESTDKWYLQGIVSLGPRRNSSTLCDPMEFTIFTKVGMYVEWIESVLKVMQSDGE